MVTEISIRDRFLKCLDEVKATEKAISIAGAIGCTPEYLSALPKNQRPAIPSAVIANFCLTYHYNPAYIITGKGKKKTLDKPTEEETDKWEVERNKYLDLIAKLIDNILTDDRRNDPPNFLDDLLGSAGKIIKRN